MMLPGRLAIALVLLTTPLAQSRADVPTPIGEIERAESPVSDREYQEAILALRRAMFPPGERVENWDVGGVDLESAVRAMGADKYYLLDTDTTDGSQLLGILTARGIADFAPAAWQVAKSYGSAEARLENPSVTFGYLSPRFILAGRANSRRVRDVDCTDKIGHAILYEVPDAPRTAADKDIIDMFATLMLAIEGQTICDRYDGDAEKGYSSRSFLADGRRLLNPDLSEMSGRVTIVPAAPVDRLITPPPAPPATQP